MENFNIKRFVRTLRWYFCENRSKLVTFNIGLALGIFLMETFILWTSFGMMEGMKLKAETLLVMLPLVPLCFMVITAYNLYAFGNIFNAVKTKQRRIAFLTLPATNLERYLSALILAVVVWPICILLAVALGDTLRMVVFGLLGKGWISGVTSFLTAKDGVPMSSGEKLQVATIYAIQLWGCSAFVLGGSLLRKRPTLITGLVLSVLFFFFVILLARYADSWGDLMYSWIGGDEARARRFEYCFIASLCLLSLVNFFCSYQLFKRFQIITSKWLNI